MVRAQHAGKWVLVDARLQVLSLGSALYRGTSPRSALDLVGRQVLVPRIHAAAVDGIERTGTTRHDGTLWATRVIPIHAPVLGAPLAVLGCYADDPSALASPPLVGAWEWKITPPGPDQQMRTYWSPSLFDVYGIPRPNTDSAYWEGPQWMDELIVEGDRVGVRRLLDTFLAATTDGLFFHTYRAKNPTTGDIHRLRYAGRSCVAEPRPPLWLRGISTRLDHLDHDATATPSPDDLIQAAFSLSPDPVCAIDTTYEHIYLTCQGFADLDVHLPPHRHLPSMVHPDDLPRLRTFLTNAARLASVPTGPIQVRFTAAHGGWTTLTLSGTGVRLIDTGDPHHVLCRLTPADP